MEFHKRFNPLIRTFILTFFLMLSLLYPLSGLVLNGYELNHNFLRPLLLALGLATLRTLNVFWVSRNSGRQFTVLASRLLWPQSLAAKVKRISLGPQIYLILIVATLVLPLVVSKYWLNVLVLSLIYILLGLGLNIVVGLAGLLDLGFVGFYAVGAYTFGLMGLYSHFGFWTALPLAGFFAAFLGVFLAFPVLRMHGDYLAIVTLGFGEIIRLILNNWIEVTGGPNGLGVPLPTFFGLEFSRTPKYGGKLFHEVFNLEYDSSYRYIFLYFVAFIMVSMMIAFSKRIRRLPLGRTWLALKDDEIACRALGINHVAVKLWAFAIGAFSAGVAGVLFAAQQGFVNPTSFTFFESALILAIVVLGGMGSILGVVIAAVVMTLAPEVLRNFSDYRVLIFGILMVAIMIIRPAGLIKNKPQIYQL